MSEQHDQEDDDGTVIRPRSQSGGAAVPVPADEDGLALPIGTRLGEFEITGRIGDGGFSIVYHALDHSLERTVALKEYMPSSLAMRTGRTHVQARSERFRDTFDAGLRSFVNEAKLLAQFDHPALVKVYRFWEAHGTAYMVMPWYQGETLKDAVRAMGRRPDEAWLLGLLGPLTQALLVIHAERCYHRDIAPDNVLLLAGSGRPLLLDFGAARRVIGDMTQGLTVILKSGYAPVEQYAEVPGMKQGPWTDVYALAAVVYWAITGATPPPSVGRMLSDSFVPLGTCAAGRYSAPFLAAIDRALALRPEHRTPSIGALRVDLGLDPDLPATGADARTTPSAQTPPPAVTTSGPLPTTEHSAAGAGTSPPPARAGRRRIAVAGALAAGLAAAAAVTVWWRAQQPEPPSPTESAPVAATLADRSEPASAPIAEAMVPRDPAPDDGPGPATPGTPTSPPPDVETGRGQTGSGTASAPRPKVRDRPPPRNEPAVDVRTQSADAAAKAECARLFQRFSLGESNPALLERMQALRCR